ncbi:hypothetical protein Bbelb_061220 [Branchiostoma belcheri]|nr:hypothetical protein Bbelb_061220 [Branchiostoma belcheri]
MSTSPAHHRAVLIAISGKPSNSKQDCRNLGAREPTPEPVGWTVTDPNPNSRLIKFPPLSGKGAGRKGLDTLQPGVRRGGIAWVPDCFQGTGQLLASRNWPVWALETAWDPG